MAKNRNNPNHPFVKKEAGSQATTQTQGQPSADPQPWNRSTIEIEPLEATPQGPPRVEPQESPQGRYNDRIKISPMDEDSGKANPQALRGWPEGQKKA